MRKLIVATKSDAIDSLRAALKKMRALRDATNDQRERKNLTTMISELQSMVAFIDE